MSESLTQAAMPWPDAGWRDKCARALFLRLAGRLAEGSITVAEGNERHQFGDPGTAPMQAQLEVHDPRFYRALLSAGMFGAVDTWCEGLWNCDDLTGLLRILMRNEHLYRGLDSAGGRLLAPLRRLRHRARRNTRRGSRKNIAAHYDLGNDFFSLFLDETMMYSSACFERPDATLAEASRAKNERLCKLLQLSPQDHLLEIGTGWGGFALHAAGEYGCRVTTTTISREQHAFATARVRAAGLQDRIDVRLDDYRDLEGQFDKLVSIEMIEAVGYEYLDTFFRKCNTLLKPDGLFALQAITRPEQGFEQYARETDFIREYIFPGGCLVSHGAVLAATARATDFRLLVQHDFGGDYAKTLRYWRLRFHENQERIRALKYPPQFLRLWEMYLCACEAGFTEGLTGVSHLLFSRPGYRPR